MLLGSTSCGAVLQVPTHIPFDLDVLPHFVGLVAPAASAGSLAFVMPERTNANRSIPTAVIDLNDSIPLKKKLRKTFDLLGIEVILEYYKGNVFFKKMERLREWHEMLSWSVSTGRIMITQKRNYYNNTRNTSPRKINLSVIKTT
jgi:hypothetical protein